jgi:hypothetical protein
MTTKSKIPDTPSRRAMIGALAALPIASMPAVAGVAGASPLRGLIDAHCVAFDTFNRAIDREQELEEAYKEAFPPEQMPFVPILLGGSHDMRYGVDDCREFITIIYERQRERLFPLSRIAPELAEQARSALDAKEAENMELVARLFADEEARKETFGLAAASRVRDAASDAEDELLTALCAYPCETMAEARIKAEYLVSTSDELQSHHVDALLQSFLPQTNDEAEQS